jgi:predicted GNAT family acetyltransferase
MEASSQPPPQFDVSHNAAGRRFEIALEGVGVALAEYQMCAVGERPSEAAPAAAAPAAPAAAPAGGGLRVLDLFHTEVPPALQGKGIAGQLIAGVFRYAQEQGMAVRPSCSYVSDTWLPRNPEYNAMCEAELVGPACVERTMPTPAEAAAAMDGAESDDDDDDDDEWGEAALLNMQGHTFRLARQQYQAQVAELGFSAEESAGVRAKTLTRLGQLLLNRTLELLPQMVDTNIAAEIKQHIRDAQAIQAQLAEIEGAAAGAGGTELRKFESTLEEASKLL